MSSIYSHINFCKDCWEYFEKEYRKAWEQGEYVHQIPNLEEEAHEILRKEEADASPFTWDYIKLKLEGGSQWAKWKIREIKEKLKELASTWPAFQPEMVPTRGGRLRIIEAKLLDEEMRDTGKTVRLKMIREASFADGIFQCVLETPRPDLIGCVVYLTIHFPHEDEEEKVTFTSKFNNEGVAEFYEEGFEEIPSSRIPVENLSVAILKPE